MSHAVSVLFLLATALLVAHGEEARWTSVKELAETVNMFLPSEEQFSVTGQVVSIFHRDGVRTISLTDGDSRIAFADKSSTQKPSYGDIVEVSGTVIRNRSLERMGITASSLKVVGHKPLPKTAPLDWNELRSVNSIPTGFRSIQGVVSSVRRDDLDVHWNWLTLRGESMSIPVAMAEEEYPYASLTNLVDAEVVFQGCLGTLISVFAKRFFSPLGTNGVSIVRLANAPFSAPPLGTGDIRHRQTVRGVVKATGRNRLFMQMDAPLPQPRHFISVHLAEPRHDVQPGDVVTVSGFQNVTGANLRLTDAVLRLEGEKRAVEEEAKEVAMEALFTSPLGVRQVSQVYHGRLIRVIGTVITTQAESRNTGLMRLRKGDMTVEVQVSEIDTKNCESAEEGCLVAATGLCIVEMEDEDTASALPIHKRTMILPRTADDIQVLAHPPWWTTPRLVAVITLLCALLAGAMAWNKVLKERARKQAEALFKERMAHSEAEVKVEVRTHLAVELHDSISQSLTGIALQLDSAERANQPPNAALARFLGLARQMLGSCRRELQSCLLDLRNRTFEEKDLSEAIRLTVSPLSDNAEVSVRFNVPREPLPDTTVHTILKIVRELVVNAIRHGKASHVRIAGEMEGDVIRFSVRDDGSGFDADAAPGPMQGHFGLQGIRERLDDFGGSVTVESSRERGTKVTVAMKATMEE